MILAGAGTGKTRVITARIAYALAQGVPPSQVGAMTFTNKAAREMKERLSSLVGESQTKKLTVGTFHSFCLKLLRTFHKEGGLSPRFRILGASEQLDMVRRAMEEGAWTGYLKPEDLLNQISLCKNKLLTPDDLENHQLPDLSPEEQGIVLPVYRLYERLLVMHEALDFDDCIFKAVLLLKQNPMVKERVRSRYRFILVDEFQDTNGAQMGFLEELVPRDGNICVVGDDDQSIYSWRGAMYETLERFESLFPGMTLIKLEQNYRCSPAILTAANALIRHNQKRKAKTLWSDEPQGEGIILKDHEDAEEEAQWVARSILGLMGQGLYPQEIAVLYRANTQAKLIEMALKECVIPFRTFGGQSFFEKKEIKDFMAFLRLVIHPEDALAFWRVINTPTRGLGLKTQEGINQEAKERKESPYGYLKNQVALGYSALGKQDGARDFVTKMEALRRLPLDSPQALAEVGRGILQSFGLVEHLRLETKNQASYQHKKDTLLAMPEWLCRLAEERQKEHGEAFDLGSLLDALTLQESHDIPKKDRDKDSQTVSLMTIHGAKGLEFTAVFVVGLEEGSLPHKNSVLEEDDFGISEERRLFYVAMTRAKRKLFLSYAALRQSGFSKEQRKPSRFLKELPDLDFVEAKKEPTQEERKGKTLARLAQLRESLK
jgi:DNA helicase-2/ATP-dependent DNA helicase PcrA